MRDLEPLCGAVTAALLLFPSAAWAEVYHVPGDFPTIQQAIAGAAMTGDEIIVAPGIYDEAIDFVGKAIILRSSHGPEATTIDATARNTSVVKCVSEEDSATMLVGFRITGGAGTNVGAYNVGGGMYCRASSPTIMNCLFENNGVDAGGDGGAIYIEGGSPSVTNCVMVNNSAGWGGGLMSNGSNATVFNCSIARNTGAVDGGGIFHAFGNLTVSNSIVYGNLGTQVTNFLGLLVISYSDVEGGFGGTGNIDANPLFEDAINGDCRLYSGSPCIDAADNLAVPPDLADLDGDLDRNERVPFDLDGYARFCDDPDTPDTGNGTPPIVDMGAYEFSSLPPVPVLVVFPEPLVAGAFADFYVDTMAPHADTFLAYSVRGLGEKYVPFLNVTLDLKRPSQIGGIELTDSLGSANWVVFIPTDAAGFDIWFQAAQFENKTIVVETNIE